MKMIIFYFFAAAIVLIATDIFYLSYSMGYQDGSASISDLSYSHLPNN